MPADTPKPSSPTCLDIKSWRASTPSEVADFFCTEEPRPNRVWLIVETRLRPVDVYSYLMARFGQPNGFQNVLRRDDSDNIIHWDYNLKARDVDIYFAGAAREVHISVS